MARESKDSQFGPGYRLGMLAQTLRAKHLMLVRIKNMLAVTLALKELTYVKLITYDVQILLNLVNHNSLTLNV